MKTTYKIMSGITKYTWFCTSIFLILAWATDTWNTIGALAIVSGLLLMTGITLIVGAAGGRAFGSCDSSGGRSGSSNNYSPTVWGGGDSGGSSGDGGGGGCDGGGC